MAGLNKIALVAAAFCLFCPGLSAQTAEKQYSVEFTAVYRGHTYKYSKKTALEIKNDYTGIAGGNAYGRSIIVHCKLDPKDPGIFSLWYAFEIANRDKSEPLDLGATISLPLNKKLLAASGNGWKLYIKASQQADTGPAADTEAGNYLLTTTLNSPRAKVPAKILTQQDTQGSFVFSWNNGGASNMYTSQWKTEKSSADGKEVKLSYYVSLKINGAETVHASVEHLLRSGEAAKALAKGKNWELKAAIAAPTAAPAAGNAAAPGEAGIQWVTIPAGSFIMGSKEKRNEQPKHRVSIHKFQLAKTLVTIGQYKKCIEAGSCKTPHCAGDDNVFASMSDDYPAVCVTWDEARMFSEWVGGRLPSEAEWEYAARSAGKNWEYPWGNYGVSCDKAVTSDCAKSAAPVCSKPAGNTRQGLCDMAGNVWEWTQDRYNALYTGAPADGSAWESPATGDIMTVRGGSWRGVDIRASRRGGAQRGNHAPDCGFRPAKAQ